MTMQAAVGERAHARTRAAVQAALRLVARRARTEQELREALAAAHDEAASGAAVARLLELGYLDDREWARAYVARRRSQVRGRALLRRELLASGVSAADAAEALAAHEELDAARRAIAGRNHALRSVEPDRRRRRLSGFLMRRGFSRETADAVLRDAGGRSER